MIKECNHEERYEVCGTLSCPKCYYEELVTSKDRAKVVEIELVYDESKHRKVVRKKKNVLPRTNVSTV